MSRIMRRFAIFVCLTLFACLAAFPAKAQKRVALVIGNSAYRSGSALTNSVNDASLVAGALHHAKFQVIEAKNNLGIADFRQTLRRFQGQADGADVAFIYFAGHGVEANGSNWLIPIDAELARERDLNYEAIPLDLTLQALKGARMRILVLDACRNNPFGRNWGSGTRDFSRGLRPVETDDVLVLFAAAPGRTAMDGIQGSVNSPFASALAKRIPEVGLAVQFLAGLVRDDVMAVTGGEQRPYVSASITGTPFYLVPEKNIARPTVDPEAERIWGLVRQSKRPTEVEAFIRRYGDTYFGDLAKLLLADLNNEIANKEKKSIDDKLNAAPQPPLTSTVKSESDVAITTPKVKDLTESCATIVRQFVERIAKLPWTKDPDEINKNYADIFADQVNYYNLKSASRDVIMQKIANARKNIGTRKDGVIFDLEITSVLDCKTYQVKNKLRYDSCRSDTNRRTFGVTTTIREIELKNGGSPRIVAIRDEQEAGSSKTENVSSCK